MYDIDPKPMAELAKLGAVATASAKEATSNVTLTALPSSVEVRAATYGENGILAGLAPGSILNNTSSEIKALQILHAPTRRLSTAVKIFPLFLLARSARVL